MTKLERFFCELSFALSFLLLSSFAFAENSLSGPTISIQTDKTRTDDDINIGTQNSGVINFYTGNTKRLTITAAGTLTGSALTGIAPILPNNTYLEATNNAGSGVLNLIKGSALDNTIVNSSTGKAIKFQLEEDSNRLLTFDAASDTALTMTFGDGGTTAVQQFTISASTADADDDSTLILAGGGANGGTRGASITLPGEEVAGGSDITYNAGTGDTHIFNVAGTNEVTLSDDKIAFGVTTGGTPVIGTSSVDATDDNTLVLTAGSAAAIDGSRGATIYMRGNEVASTGGTLNLFAGIPSTANINFFIEHASSAFNFRDLTTGILFTIGDNGDLTQEATNGGNLIMSKAGKGVLLGATAADTDITTVSTAQPHLYISDSSATEDQVAIVQHSASTAGALVRFYKTRAAATDDANTVIVNGDTIATLGFFGSDGADYKQAASIKVTSDGAPSTGVMPGAITFATKATSGASTLDRLKLDSAGALNFDATNGGDLIMSKVTTGLVSGETSRAANVTTATVLAVPLYVSAAGSSQHLAAFIGTGNSASGAAVSFFKTRATSGAATTIIQSGDTSGLLRWYGSNGTTYDPLAEIRVKSAGTPGANPDMPGSMSFFTTPDSSATLTQALIIGADQSSTFAGTVTSSRATDLGWSVVDQTDNQACNTGCTSACVYGWNVTAGNVTGIPLSCTDTASDVCICAGAS